ncbi:MAG: choice-of-anchor L domain-containing protein [Chitinophagales bacterium]
MKKNVLLSFLSIFIFNYIHAQLTVSEETDDEIFIYSLAGPGIVVSDIERTCAEGASGFFNSTDANVGIENGMILTSGSISNAMGPNNLGSASMPNSTDGDDDLSDAAGYLTYDGCIIEFNMTVAADTLKLSYVFGSEEYLEFAGTGFNDIFAFWVSGPGIPDPVNIALVPGTTLPVAINNVNSIENPDYYIDNGDGFAAPYSTDPFYVQYDGLTTVLLASTPVSAGETYHMKIAIADGSDMIYDSGVFLETGSLGSLRLKHESLADFELDNAVEKCANGYFKFTNEVPCAEPLVLDYYVAGSATNGVDYELIAEQLIIPAWDSIGIIEIAPLHDAITESLESVVLYLYNPQSGFIYDTLSLLIDDELELAGFESIVTDLNVQFAETSGEAVAWEWDFGDGTYSSENAPLHTYAESGVYEVCLTITNDITCTDESCSDVVVGTVGINNENADAIIISPNPVDNILHVEFPANITGTIKLTIVNITGQTIYSETKEASAKFADVDLSVNPSGIYFVQLSAGENIYTRRLEKL